MEKPQHTAQLRCPTYSSAPRPFNELSAEERTMLAAEAPSFKIPAQKLATGFTITDALTESYLATSKSDARRLIEGKGVTLNGETIESPDLALTISHFAGNLALLRKGKQVIVLVLV